MNGNLADDPLPTLLQQLFAQKATGVLHIQNRAGRHDVYLRGGYPVAVNAARLGGAARQGAVRDGHPRRGDLQEDARRAAAAGTALRRHARSPSGCVTEDQMRLALKAQVRRKLHRLFFLNDGTFEFAAGEHDQGLQRAESLRIHPARAIYHGVRSAWNAERLEGRALPARAARPSSARSTTRASRATASVPTTGASPSSCARATGRSPDLVEAAGLPPQPVHALVYALYISEALEIKVGGRGAAAAQAHRDAAAAQRHGGLGRGADARSRARTGCRRR